MATTVEIADLITDATLETERLMQADSNVDYASAKLRAIALAKVAVYGAEKDEDDISAIEIRRYIADLALRDSLLPAAIDWCSSKTRISDSKDGATIQWPDKVQALQDQLSTVQQRIRDNQDRIMRLVRSESSSADAAQINISILDAGKRKAKHKLLDDPWTLAGYR